MSSARLCSLVAELGYEGAGKLDPDSFEWPFQYDDARPILDWICSSLRPSNVLSLSELSLYEQFQRDGKLLEGDDLNQAYDSISAFSSRRNNQEAVFGAEESIKEVRLDLHINTCGYVALTEICTVVRFSRKFFLGLSFTSLGTSTTVQVSYCGSSPSLIRVYYVYTMFC